MTITKIAANCQPVAFTAGTGTAAERMIFNRRNPDTGLWDVYRNLETPASLTSAHPDLSRAHRGATSMAGTLLLIEASTGTGPGQEPGQGVNNDLLLLDTAGGTRIRLTSSPGDAVPVGPLRKATIWGGLHPSGERVCWAECVQLPGFGTPGELFGFWEMHVADIVDGALANEHIWPPRDQTGAPTSKHFIETYGWLPDGRLVFASCAGTGVNPWGHWLSSQIWAMPDDPGATPVRLTPSYPPWTPDPYCEFATVAPAGMFDGGPWLLFSTIYGASPAPGMDLWRLSLAPNAPKVERLTTLNASAYAIVGQLAFDPQDPHTIYAGVAADIAASHIDAYTIVP